MKKGQPMPNSANRIENILFTEEYSKRFYVIECVISREKEKRRTKWKTRLTFRSRSVGPKHFAVLFTYQKNRIETKK